MLAARSARVSNSYSVAMPTADYKLAIANQDQLMAQYQRTADYKQSVAGYQAGVSKITTVDQFLNNYSVLKVALQAYGMSDQISSKGLLKQLLRRIVRGECRFIGREISAPVGQFHAVLRRLHGDFVKAPVPLGALRIVG